MALAGIKVLELEGIGPGPLAGCILADFGADVVTICRAVNGKVISQRDPVSRGKRSIALDLKSKDGIATLKAMSRTADVFTEPFRPGVVEKMGIGPRDLMAENPRLIYGRMTGWGQGGDPKFEKAAGHDSNYLSLAGTLSLFVGHGRAGMPMPPINFAGDYAGGGVMLALGVLLAIIERATSDQGQVVDAAMVDGANYVALPVIKWKQSGFLPSKQTAPNKGFLDPQRSVLNQGPHFGMIYECKDGGYMSVQAIEPQFYQVLLEGLGLGDATLPHQMDVESWPWMKTRFECIFRTKTRDEWAEIFYGTDACCVPVLSIEEAARHPHAVKRGSFAPTHGHAEQFEPAPAPKLSRTPGHDPRAEPVPGGDTRKVLAEYGFDAGRLEELLKTGVAVEHNTTSKL